MAKGDGSAYALQVLDRVFDLVDELAVRPGTVGDLSTRLGLHRSTAFRLLSNLEHRGYVRKDDLTGIYHLGFRLFQLGTKALEEEFPIHRLRPMLEELATTTQYTSQLWIRSGLEAICVDQAESPRDIRVVGRIGRRFPLNAGAVGKTFLAYAPERVFSAVFSEPLPRMTPRSVTDPAVLEREVSRIREQGWALSIGENRVVPWVVAAPVYNGLGAVEIAVAVIAGEDDVESPGVEQVREAVVETAGRMSRLLGYRSHAET